MTGDAHFVTVDHFLNRFWMLANIAGLVANGEVVITEILGYSHMPASW